MKMWTQINVMPWTYVLCGRDDEMNKNTRTDRLPYIFRVVSRDVKVDSRLALVVVTRNEILFKEYRAISKYINLSKS